MVYLNAAFMDCVEEDVTSESNSIWADQQNGAKL